MQLSPHFTLAELTYSQTAAREGIDNTPSAEIIENLKITAELLEQVRAVLKTPLVITSGYRCLILNRKIGSLDSSAHVQGQAADFIAPGYGDPYHVCAAIQSSGMVFDQLIHEFKSWTHIAWSKTQRKQVLTIDSAGTRFGL